MANRYWVYNGGNINDTTHWSATSGGAGGASKPTLSDNVIFDANSFTLNAQVVTLNEAFNCLSMDWTGITKTVTLSSSVYSLNLYGNLTLATNLTWLFTGTAYLNHKASGTVMTNGVTLNANRVYFDAAVITVTNGDNANHGSASFYLTNGTWNTNGKTITSTGSFNTVAGTKALTLGASVFNIGTWINAVTAGFTFNANTSTVVIITASILTGVTSFYNLTCSGVAILTLANNITVTNALTLAGSSVSNRLKILSSVAGTQRTVTVPAAGVFPSNLDVQDMLFPNAVDMSAIAGYSQDFGNNTGVTFTASANLFFKHTSGAANWGDITKWVLADRATQGRIPLIQDDVNFDSLSFTGTSTISLNVAATCRSMNWTGLNQAVTLSSAVNSLSIYGHTTLATGLVWNFTGTGYTYMIGTGTHNITSNGVLPMFNVLQIDKFGSFPNGTWVLQDDANFGGIYINIGFATFNTNDKTFTVSNLNTYVSGGTTLNFGNSILNLGSLNSGSYAAIYINAGTSTLNISGYINVGGYCLNLYDVNMLNTSTLSCSAPSLTIRNFTKLTGGLLSFQYLTSLIITNLLTIKGVNSNTNRALISPLVIDAQLSITAAAVLFENVDFRDIKGLGAANWDLSAIPGGSGDCGGNSNITFTPSQTQYYKHTAGSCNWSDPKWYDLDRTTLGRVPLPQDDAIFDELSFTGDSSLSGGGRLCRSLDMSKITFIVDIWANLNFEFFGSCILSDFVATHNVSIFLHGRGNYILNTYSKLLYRLYIDNPSGMYTNISAINTLISNTQSIQVPGGHVNFNSYNIVCSNFVANSPRSVIYLGTCNLYCNWINSAAACFYNRGTMYGENSNIIFAPASGGANLGFDAPNTNVNKVQVSGNFTGTIDFIASGVINELIIDPGRKVRFTAGTTTTIGKLTAIGTQSQPITIGSVTAATHNLVKTGSDMVEVEYCNISNSNATPTDKWSGGDTSVDGGGNSGWTFKYIPIIMWFFGIFRKK